MLVVLACLLGVVSLAYADQHTDAPTCVFKYNNDSEIVQVCSVVVDGETITQEYNFSWWARLIGYALPAFVLAVIAHAFILVVNPIVLYYGVIKGLNKRISPISAKASYTSINSA